MYKLSILIIFLLSLKISFSQTVKEVTSVEFQSILQNLDKKTSVIIDGRDSLMYQTEHIENAININAFSPNAENLISKYIDKEIIVVYCTMNNKTSKLIEILKKLEYKGEIIDIKDGITGWKSNGFKTVANTTKTEVDKNQTNITFKPSGKIIVQVFGNFDYNATQAIDKKYGFWFGRAHFGYEYQFSKQFSGKIIIDGGRPTTIGTISVKDTSGNNLPVTNTSKDGAYYTMNLKFASVEWKPSELFKIQAGAILQNHYITQERFWGYRYLAETFQDRYYKIPSTDLGFITYIKPSKKFSFDIALTNGEGFRFDQDNYGDVKLATGLDFNFIKKLQTRIYYDYTKSKNPLKPAIQQMFSAFAGYKYKDKFRLGAEYNYRINHLNIANQDLYGYSIYGSVRFKKIFEYFARYDNLLSNTKPNETQAWNYNADGQAIITGVHFNPINNINFSINYQGFIPNNSNLYMQHHILFSFEYKI